MKAKIITMLILAVLMLVCLAPPNGLATSEKSFNIKNNNCTGDDHGYIRATYNGSSVTIERNETHTFIYIPDANSVRIDFIADPDYRFEYYVIGNGAEHLTANPSYFDVREYSDAREFTYRCSYNDTINLNPKWTAYASYTIDTSASTGGTITPDRTVCCGSDCTVSYRPDTGYHLASVNVDGEDSTNTNPDSYTFRNVTSDHSISVDFEADIYNIAYELNGGNVSTPNPAAYTVLTPAFILNNPEKYGYKFAGWTGTGLSGSTLTVTVPADLGGDREYTANWEPAEYTVTFGEGAHGTAAGPKTFTGLHYGDIYPNTPEITPEAGWAFDGWPVMPDIVTCDASYTAAYTQLDYTVTFDTGINGTTADPTSFIGLHYGDTFPTAPNVTPYSGWTFDYWTPALPFTVESSAAYCAHYTQLRFTVTWNNWDNTEIEKDINVGYGTMPCYDGIEPVKPSTEQYDYTFSGWTPAIDIVTGDVTYTAQFMTILRNYTITFKDYDGVVLGSYSIEYGGGATAPADPESRTGYHFTGWDFGFSNITCDLTITAQYAINNYKVRFFEADGKTRIGVTQIINWGGAASIETVTEIAGKTFIGWELNGDDPSVVTDLGSVKENIEAIATYDTELYTVVFVDYNGKKLGTDMVPYGEDAAPPDGPSREGYAFTGWNPSYKNVTGDITIFAQYTVKTYTVTFADYDGKIIDTQTVGWNTGAVEPDDPIRDGYIFKGWDVPFINITRNTVVTAVYEAIAVPSETIKSEIDTEPIPRTGGGSGWMWWLLLIPLIVILLLIIAAGRSVTPVAEALIDNRNGTYTIQWGYYNRKFRRYKVEEDKSVFSVFTGKLIKSSANPPVEFESGRVEGVFTTIVDRNAEVQWKINNRKAKVDLKKLE